MPSLHFKKQSFSIMITSWLTLNNTKKYQVFSGPEHWTKWHIHHYQKTSQRLNLYQGSKILSEKLIC